MVPKYPNVKVIDRLEFLSTSLGLLGVDTFRILRSFGILAEEHTFGILGSRRLQNPQGLIPLEYLYVDAFGI